MRTSRLQLLAAAGVAVASLALTACQDGTGTRDEGASASQPVASAPSGASSQAPEKSPSGSGGNGSTANGSGGDAAGTGDSGGKASTGDKGSSAGTSGGSDDAPATFNPCNGANTSVTAAPVSRPVNHMLITVKNTGAQDCDLTYYPVLRFDGMQWVPQPIEDSKPQAVVTLGPGESAYAGVLLSAADGSGSGGATGKKLTVGFQARTPNSDGGPAAIPSLPAKGVYYDSSLTVTYWQSSMDDALAY